jgi:hypothetical protein
MTAIADLLTRVDRRRLAERLAEADELDRLIREPGGLPSVPEPVPLHRAGRGTREAAQMLPARRRDGPGNRRCATSGRTENNVITSTLQGGR